jgi:hypothetical protein
MSSKIKTWFPRALNGASVHASVYYISRPNFWISKTSKTEKQSGQNKISIHIGPILLHRIVIIFLLDVNLENNTPVSGK